MKTLFNTITLPIGDGFRLAWDKVAMAIARGKLDFRDRTARRLVEPATLKLIGDVTGQRVLDAACGNGWLAKKLARRGATVTGVDFSQEMINLASSRCKSLGSRITFHVADLGDLTILESSSFDVAVCHMALMAVRDHSSAISELGRVLKPNGRLIWSVLHPCFLSLNDFSELGWTSKKGHWYPAHASDKFLVDRYFEAAENEVKLSHGIRIKHVHRPLCAYFDALQNSGFATTRVLEPTEEGTQNGKAPYQRVAYYWVAEAVKFERRKASPPK